MNEFEKRHNCMDQIATFATDETQRGLCPGNPLDKGMVHLMVVLIRIAANMKGVTPAVIVRVLKTNTILIHCR